MCNIIIIILSLFQYFINIWRFQGRTTVSRRVAQAVREVFWEWNLPHRFRRQSILWGIWRKKFYICKFSLSQKVREIFIFLHRFLYSNLYLYQQFVGRLSLFPKILYKVLVNFSRYTIFYISANENKNFFSNMLKISL